MANLKLQLIELRQNNCGYNPEKAMDFYKVSSIDSKALNILCTDRNDNHVSEWFQVPVSNEIEFIQKYPETYGLVYKNKFYIQNN